MPEVNTGYTSIVSLAAIGDGNALRKVSVVASLLSTSRKSPILAAVPDLKWTQAPAQAFTTCAHAVRIKVVVVPPVAATSSSPGLRSLPIPIARLLNFQTACASSISLEIVNSGDMTPGPDTT